MKYPILAFAVLLPGLILLVIPNSYGITPPPHQNADYNDQKLLQQDYLWYLGKNLSVGDSYTYKICDPETIQTSAANYHYFTQGNENHNSSVCYLIKLDFVNLLNSDENQINRDVWVVQAAISDEISKEIRYSVFHIDTQTYEVSSADTIHPDTIKYTKSLQDTLFSINKYTAPEPQLLQIGQGWGEVTEALHQSGENPYMTVLDNNQEFSVTQNEIRMIDKQIFPKTIEISDAFEVGYEIDIQDPIIFDQKKKKLVPVEKKDTNNVSTSFLISNKLPFPLSGESYNPVYVTHPQKQYEFELMAFQTNNKDIDFTNSFLDEKHDNVITDKEELPTETGFIKLTIPDDDNDIENNDNSNIVDDNDHIPEDNDLEVIPEDEDEEIVPDDDIEVIPEDDVEIISNDVPVVNNDKVDYSKIVGLVVLLSVMITGFIIFKKFKESGFKNILKQQPQEHQSTKKKKIIIPFDDKLHIDIKSKEKV